MADNIANFPTSAIVPSNESTEGKKALSAAFAWISSLLQRDRRLFAKLDSRGKSAESPWSPGFISVPERIDPYIISSITRLT